MCVARELCLDGLSRVEIFGAIARRDTLHKLVQQPHLRVCRQPWLDTAPSCWVGAEELEDVVAPAVLDGGVGSLFEQVLDYRVAPYALLRRDRLARLNVDLRQVTRPVQRGAPVLEVGHMPVAPVAVEPLAPRPQVHPTVQHPTLGFDRGCPSPSRIGP